MSVTAGPVSVTTAELAALRVLVSEDRAAADRFSNLHARANRYLTESPNPLERIVSQGRLRFDPEKEHTRDALQDMGKIDALGWAWAVTGDRRYARHAKTYILAWARKNRSDGNPINETNFEDLIRGYDLVRATFSRHETVMVDRWLSNKARRLLHSPRGRTENWQSHRLKIVGLIALATNDTPLWNQVSTLFKAHIRENFRADGESVDFERRDALHYHLYSVNALLTLACAARGTDEQLFSYRAANDASLRQAVDFVLPFTRGSKEHVEFANSQEDFDKQRAENGEAQYQPHRWNPKRAIGTFSEAACLDERYGAIALQVAGRSATRYANWQMVVDAALAVAKQGPTAEDSP